MILGDVPWWSCFFFFTGIPWERLLKKINRILEPSHPEMMTSQGGLGYPEEKHTNQPESAKISYIPMICLLSIWLARYPAYVSPWNWLNLTTTKLQYSTSFLFISDSHLLLRLLTSISIHFWSVVATSARVLGKSPTTSWSNPSERGIHVQYCISKSFCHMHAVPHWKLKEPWNINLLFNDHIWVSVQWFMCLDGP